MKAIIKKLVHRFGYEITRAQSSLGPEKPFRPYIKEFSVQGKTFRFWIYNYESEQWNTPELFEFAEMRELVRFAKACRRVIEVGSHHGFTAMVMSKFMDDRDSILIGMESYPVNTLVCQAQASLNQANGKLLFINKACSNSIDEILRVSDCSNSAVLAGEPLEGVTVESETVDHINQLYGSPDLLKIDVEGHEYEVLQGATETLKSIPKIALELHIDILKNRGIAPSDVLRLIDLTAYTGKMELRTDRRVLLDFDTRKLPEQGIANLLLERKP